VRLSVVVPALNEERHLGRLLSDIRHQSQRPDEIIVVDAGSSDATARIAERARAVVLYGGPPVAHGRNLGGRSAVGDLIFFLDADTRLPETFFEEFVREVERRSLDVACPRYRPFGSTPTIGAIHAFWNGMLRVSQRTLPSGAGHCIALRSELFRESRGFDPSLKFDDIELVRRLSKGRHFGIVATSVYVSDRRYREGGVLHTFLSHLLMAPAFALGRFEWANHVAYEFGEHDH
jgi:glycosyltransferase involved in cell wall biosynthesis